MSRPGSRQQTIPGSQLRTAADGCAGCALYEGAPAKGQVEDAVQPRLKIQECSVAAGLSLSRGGAFF